MKIFFARTFAIALVLILSATGLWAAGAEEAPAAAADKKYVTDPTTGKAVTAPEYGGTLTYAYKSVGTTLDPAFEGHRAGHLLSAVNEKLGIPDWGVDREVEDFRGWYQPTEVFKGHLAESWDISADGRTYIFHIRQGVHWHDKEPMNGRELTADDIVYNLMRYAGLTDFVPPRTYEMIDLPIESIEATDKYTVVIKLSEPRLAGLRVFINEVNAWMLPPDVIEQYGDMKDWRNVVGTGPLMLTDYVEGVSSTRTKNPDYWGYDEKYPENRLPYVDQLRGLFMEEEATRLAAMRTGKIDLLHTVGGGTTIKVLDTVRSLQKTNPEIQVTPGFIRSMNTVGMNIRKPPFDDINVRRAMQMALDLETFNATYFGGYAKWKPQGIIGDANVGYYIPFEEWPEEVKQYYRYDPEGAEALLDAAGYPRGADGIRFKTTLDFWDVRDLAYTEITAGYWDEIGVDVEINVYETIPWATRRAEMTYQLTSGDAGFDQVPSVVIGWYTAIKYRAGELGDHVGEYLGGVEDPTLDRLYEAFQVATTVEEQQRIFREFDMYYVSRSTQVWGAKAPFFQAVQPWVIGFSGENFLGDMDHSLPLVRLWIDSELKEAMGY